MADEDDGEFTIRELTGDRRIITLTARALPYRPFTLDGTHQVETTWYQGSPVATQQPSGARLEPTSINGWWKDRFLGGAVTVDGELVGDVSTARGLAALFQDLNVKGQLVQADWNHVRRVGIVTRFKQSWHTPTDLEWELTFTWQSMGQEGRPASSRTAAASLPDTASEMAGKASDLDQLTQHDALLAATGRPPDLGLVDRLDRAIGDLQGRVFELTDAVAGLADGANVRVDSAMRVASTLTLIETQAQVVATAFRGTVDRTICAVQTLPQLADIRPGLVVAAATVSRSAIQAARALRHGAARRRYALAQEQIAPVIAVFRAGADADLREIATTYYGVPDDWQLIRTFNGMAESLVPAGTPVLIPRREAVR